jgi:hypothetical protein
VAPEALTIIEVEFDGTLRNVKLPLVSVCCDCPPMETVAGGLGAMPPPVVEIIYTVPVTVAGGAPLPPPPHPESAIKANGISRVNMDRFIILCFLIW